MKKTKILGILNVTPDSFFIKFPEAEAAMQHARQMQREGVDIIDVGGESTRPGAQPVSVDDELSRVIPVIKAIKKELSIPISIDTSKWQVAAAAVNAGATLINDVYGFRDPAMQEIAASSNVDVCVMHMQGTPQTMQLNPHYPDGVLSNILHWFEQQAAILIKRGVREQQIILDPGIGFGKNIAHNLEIIQNLPQIKAMGFRLLVGVSRKSFMSKILNKPASELLPATIAISTLLIRENVDVLRVHDVAAHRSIIDLLSYMKN